jgi:hypothetical protein
MLETIKTAKNQQSSKAVFLLFLLRITLIVGIVKRENKTKAVIGKDTSRSVIIFAHPLEKACA